MSRDAKNRHNYGTVRKELYRSEEKYFARKGRPKTSQPEPPQEPVRPMEIKLTREWIDTPEDRAEVAAILNKRPV